MDVAEKINAIANGYSIKQLYWLDKNGDKKNNGIQILFTVRMEILKEGLTSK